MDRFQNPGDEHSESSIFTRPGASGVALIDGSPVRALLDRFPTVMVVTDADRQPVLVTGAVTAILGWEPDEFALLDAEIVHPDDRAELARMAERVRTRPGRREGTTARFRTSSGDWRWMETEITNLLDDPDVAGVVTTLHDVTRMVEDQRKPDEAEQAVRRRERRFRKLVQGSSDITLVVGTDTKISWASPALERVLGYEPEAILGTSAFDYVHPEDVGDAKELLAGVLRGEPADSVSVRVCHADTSWRYVSVVATDMHRDPDVGGMLLSVRDITARVEARRATERLGIIVEATSDLVALLERDRGLVYLNAAARRFFGLDPTSDLEDFDASEGLPTWVEQAWNRQILPELRRHGLWSGEMDLPNSEGRTVAHSVVLMSQRGPDGRIETISGVARDISKRLAFESQLEHQATHDPLTDLPNRTLLLDRLAMAIGRGQRSHHDTAVLFLDLDHFKEVNDRLGHSYGDRLLRLIAERLSSAVRPGDTVARFGGDEFVILCEGLTDRAEAEAIAERVAAAVAAAAMVEESEVTVTASIGIALAGASRTVPEDIVRDADAAMYSAKEGGRSRTEVFDGRMHKQSVDRLELESDLRRAIARHELRLLYQPQVALATGRIIGFEALLRWEHPDRGLLQPADFLAVAEETRLILPIGGWVTRQACRVLARAQHARPNGERLDVCINLSARQLNQVGLVEVFRDILDDTGVSPGSVNVEIAESVLMADVEQSRRSLERLKAVGLVVAVDDFGSGCSSLAYLRQFPVDLLKMDRTFVAGLGTESSDSAIVGAVVSMAHTLGLQTVAEGVETRAQLAELRNLGCDIAQGYVLSRPIPDGDLLDLLLAGQVLF